MTYIIQPHKYEERLVQNILYDEAGKITKTLGLLYEAYLPGGSIGSICEIILKYFELYFAVKMTQRTIRFATFIASGRQR